jgi:transcriptional regulator with XRE-family HTH domain
MTSSFASRLAHVRQLRKLTQSELATKVGMSSQAIWNYENRPDVASARSLAFVLGDALRVSPRWLATGIEDGTMPPAKCDEAVLQSIGCLEAFLASSRESTLLVEAALTLLRSTVPSRAQESMLRFTLEDEVAP